MATSHPLGVLIAAAAESRFPEADGGWQLVRPWKPGVEGVFSFTGHAVLAVEPRVTEEDLHALGVDGFGGAMHPRVIAALAGAQGWIDSVDMVLAARAGPVAGVTPLVPRSDLASHPRVVFAGTLRSDVSVFGLDDPKRRDVAVIARGLGGLLELSFELEPESRRRQRATAFVRSALAALPPGELVVAAVAPGNVASVRTLLTAGFTPIGSVQLFRRTPA